MLSIGKRGMLFCIPIATCALFVPKFLPQYISSVKTNENSAVISKDVGRQYANALLKLTREGKEKAVSQVEGHSNPSSDGESQDKEDDEEEPSTQQETQTQPPQQQEETAQQTQAQEQPAPQPQATHQQSDGTIYLTALHRRKDYYAHDGGAINEWDAGYYCCHTETENGQILMSLKPGDIVNIDGHVIHITGEYTVPEEWDYSNKRAQAGWNNACFQLCIDGGQNRIIYGWDESVSDFSASTSYPETAYVDWYNALIETQKQLEYEKSLIDSGYYTDEQTMLQKLYEYEDKVAAFNLEVEQYNSMVG